MRISILDMHRGGVTLVAATSLIALVAVSALAQNGTQRSEGSREDRARFATRERDEGRERRVDVLERRERASRNDSADMGGDMELSRQEVSASGRIASVKRVGLRNRDVKHVVVMLETARNRRGIVDLGPADELQDLRLERGVRISVTGNVVGVGDRRVLMADEITMGDRNVQIDRSLTSRMRTRRAVRQSDLRERLERPFARGNVFGDRADEQVTRSQEPSRAERSSQSGESGQSRRVAMVRGKIEKTKVVKRRNADDQNLVALVRQKNDTVRCVDLGAVSERINQDQVKQGDQLVAMGDPARIGDRPVLLAQRVRINGNEREVDRNWPSRRSNRAADQNRTTRQDRSRQGNSNQGSSNQNRSE
jgi:hypothetical protein